MGNDTEHYAAVLADLELRRKLLNERSSSLDAAIDNVRSLLNEERRVTPQKCSPAIATDRRKSPTLNIYQTSHPDLTRKMSRARPETPNQTGFPCPSCGSRDTRESTSRGVVDTLMFLFDYGKVRCRSCHYRFRVRNARRRRTHVRASSAGKSLPTS